MSVKTESLVAFTVLENTKIALEQHKLENYKKLYQLRAEGNLSGCDVAVPCSKNNIIVIDVDVAGEHRSVDGRKWWKDWLTKNGGDDTYIVKTLSGGYHFYYSLPDHVDKDTFHPVMSVAPGVDVKWNGYVVAPPSPGYEPYLNRTLKDIKPASAKLLKTIISKFHKPYEGAGGLDMQKFRIHDPIPLSGILKFKGMLEEFALHNFVSYEDWIKGIFSITAAIDNEDERNHCIELWTRNKSYMDGDVEKAINISKRSDPMGKVGPGTIFQLIEKDKKLIDVKPLAVPTLEQLLTDGQLQCVQKRAGILVILPIETNVCNILEKIYTNKEIDPNHPDAGKSLYFDIRKRIPYVQGRQYIHGVEHFSNEALKIIQGHYRLPQFKQGVVKSGVELFLSQRFIDPCAEHIKAVKWDGKRRIHKFFTSFFPCKGEEEYLHRCGTFFWRSYVYRVLEPGVKCDEIVVLVGPEGTRKTSIVGAVGETYTYYCGEEGAFNSRDCLLNMHRSTIVELEEMTAFKNCDPNTVKGYLSRTTDTVRQMFGRSSYDAPRSFIMIGTTNNQRFLTKSMGVRRFLPIVLDQDTRHKRQINVELCMEHRDQLLAEAREDYDKGIPLRLQVTEYQKELVSKHQFRPPQTHLHDEVREFIKHKTMVDVRQIFNHLSISYPCSTNQQTEKHYRAIYRVIDEDGLEDIGDGKTFKKGGFLSDIL